MPPMFILTLKLVTPEILEDTVSVRTAATDAPGLRSVLC